MYKMSWPFARLLSKVGVPVEIEVFIRWDPEAKVFVGMSSDVKGLVVEAETLDEIDQELQAMIPAMLSVQANNIGKVGATRMSYRQPLHC